MFFSRSAIPIPVIPVIYLRVSHLSILYITIYISISYVVFRRGLTPHYLIGIIGIGISRPFCYYFFLYQALQRLANLVANSEGIAHPK